MDANKPAGKRPRQVGEAETLQAVRKGVERLLPEAARVLRPPAGEAACSGLCVAVEGREGVGKPTPTWT